MGNSLRDTAVIIFFGYFIFSGEVSIKDVAVNYIRQKAEPAQTTKYFVPEDAEPVLIQSEYKHKKNEAIIWEADADVVPQGYRATGRTRALYTSSKIREWEDLSDEETKEIAFCCTDMVERISQTQAKLREKNQGSY